MRSVLDSSVAAKWLLLEDGSQRALELWQEYRDGVQQFIAPDVLPIEVAHALTRAERQGRMTLAESHALWLELMADAPQLFASLPLLPRALQLSSIHRIGIYDCLFVALAEQESCPLITADRRLHAKFNSIEDRLLDEL